ncbi:hypothetical protein BX616_006332 [Lobosporangium transversale]|nr:hypothetical protein BX616_006332 [Lobosporangium transversale]
MCSSPKLLLTKNNLESFKHLTLDLNGHDKPNLYSYKLKKSGFRIQVYSAMNNIILFASKLAHCRDYNGGTMLVKMNITSHIHKLDCIALDGGRSQKMRWPSRR